MFRLRMIYLARALTFSAMFFLAALLSTQAQAQYPGEGDYDSNEAVDGEGLDELARGRATAKPYGILSSAQITPNATASIAQAIKDSYDFCDRVVKEEYKVDCLGEQLDEIAKAIPRTGDYGPARAVLADTSRKLRKLVQQNKEPAAPRIRAKSAVRGKTVQTKPLNAVRKSAVKKVNVEAANILEEAETKLLRSAASSDRRLIAYAQMAKAVGSNKTLLRSA